MIARRAGSAFAVIAIFAAACGRSYRGSHPSAEGPVASDHASASPSTSGSRTKGDVDPEAGATPTVDDEPAGVIEGIVRGADGGALAGICVDLWFEGEEGWGEKLRADLTDAEGRFRARAPIAPPDERRHNDETMLRFRDCRAQPSLAFEWYPNAEDISDARRIDRHDPPRVEALLDRPAGSIAGRIQDSRGLPLEGRCIGLYDGTWRADVDDGTTWMPYGEVTSARDGSYVFRGLAEDRYRLRSGGCSRSGVGEGRWYGGSGNPYDEPEYPEWPSSASIALGPGEEIEGIDVTLYRDGRIAGTLSGTYCDRAFVEAVPVDGGFGLGGQVVPAAAGVCTYEISIAPGRYHVNFRWSDGTNPRTNEWYEGVSAREDATVVVVREDDVTPGIGSTDDT